MRPFLLPVSQYPPKEGSSYFQLSCVKSSARIPLITGGGQTSHASKGGLSQSCLCQNVKDLFHFTISRFTILQLSNCEIVQS